MVVMGGKIFSGNFLTPKTFLCVARESTFSFNKRESETVDMAISDDCKFYFCKVEKRL
jgi:hypothetical protein